MSELPEELLDSIEKNAREGDVSHSSVVLLLVKEIRRLLDEVVLEKNRGDFAWGQVDMLEKGFDPRLALTELQLKQAQDAIRKHCDYRGDDRCYLDDEELYKILPEGYTPPARDSCVELERCKAYIASRHNPNIEYISPQKRIEELEASLAEILGIYDKSNLWLSEAEQAAIREICMKALEK